MAYCDHQYYNTEAHVAIGNYVYHNRPMIQNLYIYSHLMYTYYTD